jgi:tetratricopeptide (TPR) repeat protein
MLTTETLGHKGIFCPIIVKAEMNGSCVASLDNYDAKAGGRLHDEKKDAIRVKIKPLKSIEWYESFTIELKDFTPEYKATLELKWENTIIRIPVNSHADHKIVRQIDQNLVQKTSSNPSLMYTAAQYYYSAKKDMNQALQWAEQATEFAKENFDYILLNTKILVALNRYPEALATAERALELGKKANRTEDVRLLSRDIEEWKFQVKQK